MVLMVTEERTSGTTDRELGMLMAVQVIWRTWPVQGSQMGARGKRRAMAVDFDCGADREARRWRLLAD